jgi:type IV secretory pathway protease TraF
MKGMAWRATTVASGLALAGIAVLATDAIGLTDVHPVLMNRSDSLPRGLYLRTLEPIALGSIVAMPTPPVILPYLEAVSPAWAKWLERHPLIKRVAAIQGDEICRDGRGAVTVGVAFLGVAATTLPDGGALPTWAGCQRLGENEIAVVGDTPDSLDSRIYGPVPAATASVYRPLIAEKAPD